MAKKLQQSRSQAKTASKSRPAATSLPNPTSTALAPITAFSPFSPHFAILTQAVDRHRLTLYSTSSSGASRLLVDYVLPSSTDATSQSGQCSAVCWIKYPSFPTPTSSSANESPQAKRQKKAGRTSLTTADSTPASTYKFVIALGLQSGQVHLFDLGQAKVIAVLTDATAAASSTSSAFNNAITSMACSVESSQTKLYAIAKDGIVRAWSFQASGAAVVASVGSSSTTNIQPNARLTFQSQSSSPNSLVSVSPSATHLLLANHTITRVDEASSTSKASYTSHASPMTHLTWIDDDHFISAAKADPVLYIWKVTKPKSPLGSIELEQGEDIVRVEARAGVIVVVGSDGFVGIYDATSLLREDAAQAKGTKLIKPTSSSSSSALVDAKLDEAGARLDLARLIKGVKLDLTSTLIKDPATSSILSTLSIPKSSSSATLLAAGNDNALTSGNSSLQRYSDGTATAGKQSGANSSSAPVGADGMLIEGNSSLAAEGHDDALNKEGGGIDDERSLEDRLRGLRVIRKTAKSKRIRGDDADQGSSSSSGESDEEVGGNAAQQSKMAPNTSLSLAASLSQALHSSDNSLISSLLTSANPDLIKGTVLRLSGPNAVLLLEACVTRLNASKRGPQKARGMVEWIKWTLRLHAGYLMSLPGLTSRLASLHSSLSARLNGHDRMLALQGRLELVLGQIELRADYDVVKAKVQGASARPAMGAKGGVGRVEKEGKVWKEDEDDSDEDEGEEDEIGEGMDVDVDDDEDSEEDSSSDGRSDSEDSDSDDDDDDDDDDDVDIENEEEEGDVEDVGLTSRTINGPSSHAKAGGKGSSAAATDADADAAQASSDEDDFVRPAQRRAASKTKSSSAVGTSGPAKAGKGLKGVEAISNGTSESGSEDEGSFDDDDEDEEEDDESDLMDEDDDEEEEEDSEEEGEGGGFLDDEAEEASEDEESEGASEEE